MTRSAYSFVRTFAAEPERELCVEHHHYLLCASAGVLRLEAQGPPSASACHVRTSPRREVSGTRTGG